MPRPALLILLATTPAWADPAPISPGFAPIAPSGITVAITPYITIPADSATAPRARINYTQAEAGRLFTNDLDGTLYVASTSGGTATPFLTMAQQAVPAPINFPQGNGFAGFAFHPNYAGNPTQPGYGDFYTTTTVANTAGTAAAGTPALGNGSGANMVEIREWHTDTPLAPTFSGTSRVVLDIDGYADNHSNGAIAFNPTVKPGTADYGNLYIGSGDGRYNDADQNAQRLDVPQGKMLRINPLQGPSGQAYTVPADNPFAGQAGTLPEIWATGLRYPQSFGWDTATGAMYINDIGQAAVEEVDLGTPGANYGWSQREGTFATGYAYGHDSSDENVYPIPAANPAFTDPIAEYSHDEGYAVGSGFLYRGTAIPALYGKYVLQDIVNGRIFVFDPADAASGGQAPLTELMLEQDGQPINLDAAYGYESTVLQGPRVDSRLSQGPGGELLIALKSTGEVYELGSVPVPEPATALLLLPPILLVGRRRVARATPRP